MRVGRAFYTRMVPLDADKILPYPCGLPAGYPVCMVPALRATLHDNTVLRRVSVRKIVTRLM